MALKLTSAFALNAISRFRAGIHNPATGGRLRSANSVSGTAPKQWLYVLVDITDVSGIPADSSLRYGPSLRH